MAGPLHGIKVLDFTTLLPGPFAAMTLADMGAEVLRICGPKADMAALAPPFLAGTDLSFAVAFLGRGKSSLTLNLKDPRARAVVERLVQRHDVLIEQFRPGVMARLGLDYESLKEVNPGLIYCSLTGYGQSGPLRDRAGHDINYLARSGILSYADRKDPPLLGIQLADVAGGAKDAVIGILGALLHRSRNGQGQHLDVAMLDSAIALNALAASAFLVNGREPAPAGELLNGGSLYDFYETRDGRYLAFGGLEPRFLEAFCRAVGRPDLAAGGPAPPDCAAVKREIREVIKTRTLADWTAVLADVEACVEPVLTLKEALDDPHCQERGLIIEVPLADGRKVRQVGHPVRYSATPAQYQAAGCAAGTHTREVLAWLGYTEEEIREFAQSGLFG